MKKIFLKLNIQKIDFDSANYDTEFEEVQYFVFYVSKNYDFASQIYTTILEEKGDWINLDYNESLGISYITLNLIFHSLIISDEDNELIDRIKNITENLINEVEIKLDINTVDQLDESENIINKNGLVISFDKNGLEYELLESEIEKFFSDNNIEYKQISKSGSWFDGGAGSVSEGFIYFLSGAVSSGITWDLIKCFIENKIGRSVYDIIKNKLENFNFGKLKKEIQDKCKVSAQDLIVKDILKDNDEILINFESDKVEINLRTDSKYNIIELKHIDKQSVK